MATANFTDAELACHCGCGGLPPWEFQLELQALRETYGRPMRLSSAYRCPEHNDRVSSTGKTGPHTKGAVDVLVSGRDALDLVQVALRLGWFGIGLKQVGPHAQRFVHLDRRPWEKGTVWSY